MSDVFMNTYHRLPVTFAKGEGAWLTDVNGKKYLDFCSGIAVNCLGHNYPPLVKAISEQAAKFNHICNYYMSDISEAFAEKLVAACAGAGMRKVFLGNSGAEANEGACKIARKYSLVKHGPGRHQIVTLRGSFHGRTITTLAATGQDVFHKDFGPFTEGFSYIPGGDIAALDNALDPNTTAGFLLEAIQGESGIRPQSKEYVAAAAKLCAERDILLMFDEVQAGVGRTGTFLACEAYHDEHGLGIKPDVVTLAKGLCGGIPVGAVLAGEKAMDVFQISDHGSTFGGNPLAAAAGIVVLDTVTKPDFLKEIARKGAKFESTIKGWKDPKVKEIRARGLMLGVDITEEAWPVLEKGISRVYSEKDAHGLLLLSAGKNTLRLLPPYIISDAEIEQGLEILKSCL
ncbi:aspartate aminotransferase family protein [Leadbettera azotonutricia]|uniref:Acetylornithine transaminase n=1 Tax=Leadbettera azotonutricia (strain ATCC BAA-888 / DSM 13862 / ZAS-9) TaxID=545695 RepID=F5Y8H0_LEAAZ|nr:acetylornithine/succinylornithine family transaminase [Leadbettera azotonutricia]AEF82109.1 acetylornithine transaminase [Leadbettera azotonutricia ZAS-9]